ncbi:hypothetical protein EYY95_12095, partial [Hafnia alvei]|uniref:RHS repeat domain-containing protein n=1 Tax=Hafnia alvei TaxID=569 RepID=UPI0010E15F8B
NYDCQHRLIKAEMPDGTVARYTYDAFNRRLSKTVNNVTTLFIWCGHRLAAQMEGDRENYRNYIYRPNSFEPLAMTCHHSFEYDYYQEHRHTDRTLPVKQKPEVYWYQNDHLGTPHCLTDAHGQAVWKSSYLAFGSIKTEANNGAGIDNPLRFAGQYHDRETGLFYNLNRYYDPAMKRYLTQDPVGLAGGLNPYLYVEGNPIRKIDPLGLSPLDSNGFEKVTVNEEIPLLPAPTALDPWGDGAELQSDVVGKDGINVRMAMSPGQVRPGGWATADDIPNVEYARNKLAIIPEFKEEISHVQEFHIPEGVRIQMGPVGPQVSGGIVYPGGGSQIQILNFSDRLKLISIGKQKTIK